MTRKPTMQDVAAHAGVSRSLVSLVFQGASNVSDERRRAVLAAADDLGYRPNRVARHLAQGRTMTIGVVVDDLLNPFFARTVEGIENELAPAGYQVLVANGGRDEARGLAAAVTLADLQVDGLILLSLRGSHAPLIELARARPTVVVADRIDDPALDCVLVDEVLGCRLAIDHLVSLGHQRILHVDGGAGASAEWRREGYRQAMTECGLAGSVDIVAADFTHEAGAKAAVQIAERDDRPTAVFAGNDLIATGLWMQLERHGIDVPSDLSLVGFDDSAVFGVGDAGLTTIRQPSQQIGARAAEMMLERISQDRVEPVVELVAPTLVERSSATRLG